MGPISNTQRVVLYLSKPGFRKRIFFTVVHIQKICFPTGFQLAVCGDAGTRFRCRKGSSDILLWSVIAFFAIRFQFIGPQFLKDAEIVGRIITRIIQWLQDFEILKYKRLRAEFLPLFL